MSTGPRTEQARRGAERPGAAGRPWGVSLDIAECLRSGGSWRGTLPLEAFERFAATVASGEDVEVAVRFEPDDLGRARVTGTCGVRAEIVCSLCGSEVKVPVECALDFRLVASEAQAEALMPDLETVVATEDRVSVVALVEDDLLLNLPEAGCDDREECENWAEQRPDAGPVEPAQRTSPFAVLGNWKPHERDN